MSNYVWHETAKKSWWDGSAISLCGVKFQPGEYVSEFWVLPATGPKCPICQALKKAGRGK